MEAEAPKRRAASACPSSCTSTETNITAAQTSARSGPACRPSSGISQKVGSSATGNGPRRKRSVKGSGASVGGDWGISGQAEQMRAAAASLGTALALDSELGDLPDGLP